MIYARYLIVPALLALLAAGSRAQDTSKIVINTRPAGATVYLNGDYELVANTPARLPLDIAGRYKARITRPGYETWKGELTFVPGSANDFDITLSMKTRYKAAFRSMFIPGWGQIYSGQSAKGMLFTASAVIFAGAIVYADRVYGDRHRDYNIALADFNSASSIEEKNRLRLVLNDKQRDAYDAETDRNLTIAFGIGVWALNMVDALVFYPVNDVFYPTVTSLGDGAAVGLTARF